jgi:hypothetical protein
LPDVKQAGFNWFGVSAASKNIPDTATQLGFALSNELIQFLLQKNEILSKLKNGRGC